MTVAVTETEDENVADVVDEAEAEVVLVEVVVSEADGDCDGVVDTEAVIVAVSEMEHVGDAVTDNESDGDTVADTVIEVEGVKVGELVVDGKAVMEVEELIEIDRVTDRLAVGDHDTEALGARDAEPLELPERLGVPL